MSINFNRREFIRRIALAYGSVLLLPACSSSPISQYRVLKNDEADCLIALCEQIIPADHDPGATDAGVIYYIDKQTAQRFPQDLTAYRQGVASLQAVCKDKYGKLFQQLEIPSQIELMKKMEKNELSVDYWTGVSQSSFFSLVLSRTMQGFYGSPRHGGNKNYVSYRMMKLDYPLLIGQNRYRNEK